MISVVMPTFNRALFLGDAVQSVLSQDYRDWELMIIDDGSTDDTANAVQPFLSDRRVKYFQRPRSGVSSARNFGLANARGSVIAYLDTDNLWYPGYLKTLSIVYSAKPDVDCAYAAVNLENPANKETEILWWAFDRKKLVENNYIDLNVFSHRKALYERFGGFDERMTRVVDWEIILRYTEERNPFEIPVIGALYRHTAPQRITTSEPFEPNLAIIRSRWPLPAA